MYRQPAIRIIANVKQTDRERYATEQNTSHKQSRRFLGAADNPGNFRYPTIEISKEWVGRRFYIRITSVTVIKENRTVRYIHPYPIDSCEPNVIKSLELNTLYFPISAHDARQGYKSFQISRTKLLLDQLTEYRYLRIFDTNQIASDTLIEPHNVRQFIGTYELNKSQLVFSLAELLESHILPIIYSITTTYSNEMHAIAANQRSVITPSDELSIRYAPKFGSCAGGDEVIMVLPGIDKRKSYHVFFEYKPIDHNHKVPVKMEFIDSKTIMFITPQCSSDTTDNDVVEVDIVVYYKNKEIGRVDFYYQSKNECPDIFSSQTGNSSNETSNNSLEMFQ